MTKHNECAPPMQTTKRGLWGEDIAAKHLQSMGYTIVERNWRHRKLEVDLIARLHDEWIFIEVKTRKKGYLASALEAVDLHKQQRIIEASHHFIRRLSKPPMSIRYDIICVEFDAVGSRIQHIPDAFISLP